VDHRASEIRRIAEKANQKELDRPSPTSGLADAALGTSSKLARASAVPARQVTDRLHRKANASSTCVTLDDAKGRAKLWGQGLLTVIVGRAQAAARRCGSAERTEFRPSPFVAGTVAACADYGLFAPGDPFSFSFAVKT
jgi:zinc protease